jgi:hypothetical protein
MFDWLHLCLIRSTYVWLAPLMFDRLHLCLIGSAYVWFAPLLFTSLRLCLIRSAYVWFASFMFDSLWLCLIGSTSVWFAPLMFDSLPLLNPDRRKRTSPLLDFPLLFHPHKAERNTKSEETENDQPNMNFLIGMPITEPTNLASGSLLRGCRRARFHCLYRFGLLIL